jgi:regulator of protease activity HflC (stomatin/prohibitin superfamily)
VTTREQGTAGQAPKRTRALPPTSVARDGPDAASPLPPWFEAAAGCRTALRAGAFTSVLLSGSALAASVFRNSVALAVFGTYALLLAAALLVTARLTTLRLAVVQGRESASGGATDAGEPAITPTDRPAPRRRWFSVRSGWRRRTPPERLERFGQTGVAISYTFASAAALGFHARTLRAALLPEAPGQVTVGIGVALLALAFSFLVASRWSAITDPHRLPEAPGLAEWLRGGQGLALLLGAVLVAGGLGLEAVTLGRWLTLGLLALCALCAVETGLRGVGRALSRRAAFTETVAPVRLLTLTALVRGRSPLDSLLETTERGLGLSLRSAWALGFLRRNAGPVMALIVLLVWASTALVVVGPDEQGLRFRFGRLVSAVPLEPGLRLTLPWPVGAIERFPVRRVATLALGYTGPPRGSLLWAQSHTGEEYQLLLGDGRELVSVDATLSYRIRDVVRYALGFQDPRQALDALAYRLLLHDMVVTDLDRLLSVDRAEFGRRFARRLQEIADREGLGLEILHVGFVSLHPPVGVASAYEDVVSAEIERETAVTRAWVTREATIPAALAQAEAEVRESEAEAAWRLADAHGAAARFQAAREAHVAAPRLYRFRQRLEALEEGLRERSLFVLDHRLTARAGELWIDLRSGTSTP